MRGSQVVFHVAGWYVLGSRDKRAGEMINVDGTRHVLSLACELEVPKIIYTSTVAVFGDTRGRLVDETYQMPADQDFLTEYDRTKWMAHYEAALPMIEKGAPIIIVLPGAVYGPGDQSLVGEMMSRFYSGRLPFPFLPGPELTLTFAHVDDIAEGHILAAEKGNPGESYILAGPALPMGEIVKIWSRVTGKPEPILHIPARFLKPFAPVMEIASQVLPIPELFSRDSLAILDASYVASPEKARDQLGWNTRPVEEGMHQTFEWIAHNQETAVTGGRSSRRILAWFALGAALGVLFLWLARRRET
jgi:nucleoside-diphosphate-sugar epimerase